MPGTVNGTEWENLLAATEYKRPKKKRALLLTGYLGIGVLGIAGILALALWAAFVLQNLWTWFVVPLGAPELNIWHIWGLLMLFRVVMYESGLARHKTEKKDDDSGWAIWGNLLGIALGWLFVLVTGWLVSGMI